ncbi:hypothetical protein FACS1894172_14260 [Spirochaetia bacterium]|nr:hypothetical protein FACS1894164_13500 [Spirochaetia bacterium]GHU34255.1 hypothetical protein FACS1894172_14260 [Spirochaetia bacterium]
MKIGERIVHIISGIKIFIFKHRTLFLRLPLIVVIISLWFLSSQSRLLRLPGFIGRDKIAHTIAYCGLAITLSLWFPIEKWRSRRFLTICSVILISTLYGIIDELHQFFTPGRDSSILDLFADTAGATIGAGLFLLFVEIFSKWSRIPKNSR